MTSSEQRFDILEQVKTHIDRIRPTLPSQLAITVGQFAFKSLMDRNHYGSDHTPSILHILHRKEIDPATVDVAANPDAFLVLETVFEPHYWFDLHSDLEGSSAFEENLESRVFDYHEEVVMAGSLSEGVTSGVLPTLSSRLIEGGKSTAFLAVFPSMEHSSDALFNAYSSMGLLLTDGTGPIILLDRTHLDEFVGVNRVGGLLSGGDVVSYLVELFLDKKGLIRDLMKLSSSFNVDLFTIFLASGASLEIYESFRNILDITLEQPMLDFDLSTASLVYVLVRAPLRLKEQLPKGYIELEVNSWLKERVGLDVAQICESIYVDEFGDRIDVVVLVGGFDTKHLFETMSRRISQFDGLIVEHDLYDKDVWLKIRSRLGKNPEPEI